jgi:hypothetical protein
MSHSCLRLIPVDIPPGEQFKSPDEFRKMAVPIQGYKYTHTTMLRLSRDEETLMSFINLVFAKTVCDVCRTNPRYVLISAKAAKKRYFLNDDNLLRLKTTESLRKTS